MVENACGLQTRPASAYIRIGGIGIATPDIMNISISRSRGQLSSTASVSFLYSSSEDSLTDTNILIKIDTVTVFTGYIKKLVINPSFRCAGEIIVRIQASDALSRIENQLITRRQKLAGLGPIAFITSVTRRTYAGWDDPALLHNIAATNSPVDAVVPGVNFREYDQFISGGENSTIGFNHPIVKNSDPMQNGGAAQGGGGFILHSHETLNLDQTGGGPSKAVFNSR